MCIHISNSATDVRINFNRLRRSPLAGLLFSLDIVANPLTGEKSLIDSLEGASF